MLISTSNFGEIDIKDEDIICFKEGLPGFESMSKFILLQSDMEDSPFSWLQSIESSNLSFVIINPIYFRKDYVVPLDDMTVSSLGIEAQEDVAIFTIVVVQEDISKLSANLKAPLVINIKNKRGKQVILDNSEYHVRHYIVEELRRQGD